MSSTSSKRSSVSYKHCHNDVKSYECIQAVFRSEKNELYKCYAMAEKINNFQYHLPPGCWSTGYMSRVFDVQWDELVLLPEGQVTDRILRQSINI